MTSEVAQSHCLCTELFHGDIIHPQPAPFLGRVHYQRKVSRFKDMKEPFSVNYKSGGGGGYKVTISAASTVYEVVQST